MKSRIVKYYGQTLVALIIMFLLSQLYGYVAFENKSVVLVDKDGKRYITAVRRRKRIVIDGRLNDSAWKDVKFQSNFIQREPHEGEVSTERTEVGVLYDSENIYFGFRCYDSEADKIIAKEMRRDAMVYQDDFLEIVIDTYHDHRSGFYFSTNPNGSKRDAVLANEGRDYNEAWDGIWSCKARVENNGWFCEIAIPWKTLRFESKAESVWGINFARMIRRKNEYVFWQLVPRDRGYFGMFRISEAGNLIGLKNLRMGGNLEMKPYFVNGIENDEVTDFQEEGVTDIGLDAKISLTANMAMDITLNTDFSQVEADREQINLTRFSLYFPEKREFFREGAEIFSFGSSGGAMRFFRGYGGGENMELFYSRRIGLVNGHEARIIGGVKLIGKVGDYHIGALNMLTDEVVLDPQNPEDRIRPTNFSVLRIRRDVLRRGSIGVMVLNKEELRSDYYNRSFGVDVYLPLNNYFNIGGYIAATLDPDQDFMSREYINKNLAYRLGMSYQTDLWRFHLYHVDVGAEFNPEMGFIRRVDYRYTDAQMRYSPRPENSSLVRQYGYQLNGKYRSDHTGRMLNSDISASFSISFQNSSRISLSVSKKDEFLPFDWEVRPGFLIPEDVYSGYSCSIRGNSDFSRPISVRGGLNYGDYYTGKNFRAGLNTSITSLKRIRMEIEYNYNYVRLPEGDFKANTMGLRMFFFFSTEFYFKAYMQLNDDKLYYNGKEKIVSNLMLRYIYSPGSDLYLVYNEIRMRGPGADIITNRAFMLKLTVFWRG